MAATSLSHYRRGSARMVILLMLAVLLAATVFAQQNLDLSGVFAQQNLDLSGQWRLLEPTDVDEHVARRLEVRQPIGAVEVLTVERSSPRGVELATYQIGVVGGLIGGIVGLSAIQATHTEFSNTWRGDHLVLMQGSYSGPTHDAGPYRASEEDWSLDATGRLVIVITERASGAESKTTRLIYERR